MKKNNLVELVEIIDRGGYKFPFEIRNPFGVKGILELRKKILKEREAGRTEIINRYQHAFLDNKIQEIFKLNSPNIINLTSFLQIEGNGKVYGLDLREIGPTHSLKDPVIAGLFLMNLMTQKIMEEEKDTLTDCGIFNSANATKYYAEQFGLNGEYYIPSNMKHLVQVLMSDIFLVKHEDEKFAFEETEVKNACYRTLFERLHKDKEFVKRALYLGHSELGWVAMYPIAQGNTKLLEEKGIVPTILLSCIGAGTFFVPHAELFYQKFGTKSILGEYEEFHPITKNHNLRRSIKKNMPRYISNEIADQTRKFNHYGREVISRKFSENPFIPMDFWNKITESYLMGKDPADLATVLYFRDLGIDIGITSGGAISLASELAQKGEVVVVPIYEKFRDYGIK